MTLLTDLIGPAILTFSDGREVSVNAHLVVFAKRSRNKTAAGKFKAELPDLDAAVISGRPIHLAMVTGEHAYILVSRHDGKEATFITAGLVKGL